MFQGLNFQLASVLFSLGFYSYVEFGECAFFVFSVLTQVYSESSRLCDLVVWGLEHNSCYFLVLVGFA